MVSVKPPTPFGSTETPGCERRLASNSVPFTCQSIGGEPLHVNDTSVVMALLGTNTLLGYDWLHITLKTENTESRANISIETCEILYHIDRFFNFIIILGMVGLGQSTCSLPYVTLRCSARCCSGESERISDGCMDKTNGPFTRKTQLHLLNCELRLDKLAHGVKHMLSSLALVYTD